MIASPDDRFLKSFAEGLLQQPEFYLDGPDGRANFVIERIEILKEPSLGDECWFNTLSPIYVKTMRKDNEGLKEVDLYPTEPKFYENLHRNLVERFSEFYGKAPVDHFDVIETANIKPKRIRIADSLRRCNLMNLRIQARSELLKFAYDAGLGEKNAMGFGCVDLINCSQHMKNLTADEGAQSRASGGRIHVCLRAYVGAESREPRVAPLEGASTYAPQGHTCCLGVENR